MADGSDVIPGAFAELAVLANLRAVVAGVSYAKVGWSLVVEQSSYGYCYLRVRYDGTGAYGAEAWSGRRWLLDPRMTESEVVYTALQAVLAAERHEALEAFRYHDVDVCSPHHHVGHLLEVRRAGLLGFDTRADAMEGV